MKKHLILLSCSLCVSMMLSACAGNGGEAIMEETVKEEKIEKTEYNFAVKYDGIKSANISSNGVAVHDPSIIEADGSFYIFGSHMSAAKSTDMMNWEMLADGYSKTNPVYGQIYDVKEEAFRYSGDKTSIIPTDDGKTHVWAPDVIFNKTTGKYNMYYCVTSTWNA